MYSLLEVKNLSKTYTSLNNEVKAIDLVSFNIYEGEFVSIIGPSGCGKSTILNILAGLDKEYKGNINFKKDLVISYMSQEDSLFPWLSVYENAIMSLKVKKMLTKENINYVKYLLDKYGLKEFMNSKINELSGGMKQRVSLIRTISIKPDLVLLDEAFSALDYVSRLKVSEDIYNILKEEKITTLMVTHDIGEAVSLSSKVIVLSKRPTKIKSIYNINLSDRKNPINNRKSIDFQKYYDLLWKDIDNDE